MQVLTDHEMERFVRWCGGAGVLLVVVGILGLGIWSVSVGGLLLVLAALVVLAAVEGRELDELPTPVRRERVLAGSTSGPHHGAAPPVLARGDQGERRPDGVPVAPVPPAGQGLEGARPDAEPPMEPAVGPGEAVEPSSPPDPRPSTSLDRSARPVPATASSLERFAMALPSVAPASSVEDPDPAPVRPQVSRAEGPDPSPDQVEAPAAPPADPPTPPEREPTVVTFRLPRAVGARAAAVVGEFNDWSPDAHPMVPEADVFVARVALEPGRAYRFRYLLDGERWENDWSADGYVPNEFGGDDSLVDLRR